MPIFEFFFFDLATFCKKPLNLLLSTTDTYHGYANVDKPVCSINVPVPSVHKILFATQQTWHENGKCLSKNLSEVSNSSATTICGSPSLAQVSLSAARRQHCSRLFKYRPEGKQVFVFTLLSGEQNNSIRSHVVKTSSRLFVSLSPASIKHT
jgi:hypothetical protein